LFFQLLQLRIIELIVNPVEIKLSNR